MVKDRNECSKVIVNQEVYYGMLKGGSVCVKVLVNDEGK